MADPPIPLKNVQILCQGDRRLPVALVWEWD